MCVTARSEDALQATADQCRKEGAAGVAVHPCNLADGAEVRACLEGAMAAARDCTARATCSLPCLRGRSSVCKLNIIWCTQPGLEQVDRLASELLAAHGCIDVLVNVAGACEPCRRWVPPAVPRLLLGPACCAPCSFAQLPQLHALPASTVGPPPARCPLRLLPGSGPAPIDSLQIPTQGQWTSWRETPMAGTPRSGGAGKLCVRAARCRGGPAGCWAGQCRRQQQLASGSSSWLLISCSCWGVPASLRMCCAPWLVCSRFTRSLNVLAPMRLTRLLAPAMVEKGEGALRLLPTCLLACRHACRRLFSTLLEHGPVVGVLAAPPRPVLQQAPPPFAACLLSLLASRCLHLCQHASCLPAAGQDAGTSSTWDRWLG